MFSDSDNVSSGFPSNWKFSRSIEENSIQTSVIEAVEKDVQTRDSQEIEVQTENQDVEVAAGTVYDETRLASFLDRICPEVIQELDRISRSNAFASYALAEDSDSEVREVLALAPQGVDGVKVSAISWSCTGSVLAVALSHTLHTGWCCHQGHVSLYNIDRDMKSPIRTLEVPSCVRSVTMHPYLSSFVAVGTLSGEVLVWDISCDSSIVNVSRTTHNDAVTQVRWVIGAATAVMLVSSSLDGHVIFWKVSPKLSSCQAMERFVFDLSAVTPGVTCFAFPHHKQDPFVVALEGGALLHCSATTAKPVASVTPGGDSLSDPVVKHFDAQPSTVTSVEFSPHESDVLATASTDQAIRIYSLLQSCAQRVVWAMGPVVGVCWSPSQAHTLASWGHSASVTVYNTLTGDVITVFAPYNSECTEHVCSAVFNVKSPCLLAVGDLSGVTHIWEVPSYLSTKTKL